MIKTAITIATFGAFVLMVTVFGFFLWQTLFATKEKAHRETDGKPAYHEQQPSPERSLGASPTPRTHNPTEEAIAEYTKWLAIFTMFLVLATIGLFVSGERNVGVANKSAKAAQQSADAAKESAGVAKATLVAANRPWIKADIKIASGLSFGEKEARLTFSYTLKNVGNAVATHIQVHPKLLPFQFGKVTGEPPNIKVEIPQMRPAEDLKKLCVESVTLMNNAAAADFMGGHVIFPNDGLPDAVNIHMLNEDIEKARAQSAYRALIPVLLFCITYRTPFDESARYTGYAFNVFRRDPNSAGGAREIQPEEGGIPAQDLTLMLLPFNSSVAN